MVDMDMWPLKVVANVLGGLFLVYLGCLLGQINISRKYLGRMLKAFDRSQEVRMWAAVLNKGILGRMLLVSILAGLVSLSDIYIKRGEVSAEDINDLPRDLKRIFLIDGILMGVSATIFIVLCILVNLRSGA